MAASTCIKRENTKYKNVKDIALAKLWKYDNLLYQKRELNLLSANRTNGQTHSNNSSATANEFFEGVWPFCGVGAYRVNNPLTLPFCKYKLKRNYQKQLTYAIYIYL